MCSKFPCVCSSHDLCLHAQAHSLEVTLVIGPNLIKCPPHGKSAFDKVVGPTNKRNDGKCGLYQK